MTIQKIPNPLYPNVILASDPREIDFGNGTGSATVQYRIRNRCTEYGAYQDAIAAIPLLISPLASYAAELNNDPTWTAVVPSACLPQMWRQFLSVSETPGKNGSTWTATATYGAMCDPADERVTYSTSGYLEIVRIPEETMVQWEVLSVQDLEDLENADAIGVDGKEIQFVPDPGGINVGHDGEVLGCERYVPELRLQLLKCFPPGTLARCDNINAFYQIDGCLNQNWWRCFAPREIQFQGIDASSTLINPVCPSEVQNFRPDILACNFLARPSVCINAGKTLCDESQCGIDVNGDPIIVQNQECRNPDGSVLETPGGRTIYQGQIYKAGFDKIDIRFEKTIQRFPGSGNRPPEHREVMRPTHIYTHRVDKLCDFATVLFP